MEKDIYKLQLSNNLVYYNVLMELLPETVFAKFVTSLVLLVLEHLQTVFHVQMVKLFITEDVGLDVQQF